MDHSQLQTIVLKRLLEAAPSELDLREVFEEHSIQMNGAEYGQFANLQLISLGYVDFGSSPFHFSITEKGKNAVTTKVDFENGAAVLMPVIKPWDWNKLDVVLHESLFSEKGYYKDLPQVIYGYDSQDSFSPILISNLSTTLEDSKVTALKNLTNHKVVKEQVDMGDFKLTCCTGSYYAAEKILDVEFMKLIQQELGAKLLVASIPRRGTLYISNGVQSPEVFKKFELVTAMKFGENENSEPVSKRLFIVADGKLEGVIELDDSTSKKKESEVAVSKFHPLFAEFRATDSSLKYLEEHEQLSLFSKWLESYPEKARKAEDEMSKNLKIPLEDFRNFKKHPCFKLFMKSDPTNKYLDKRQQKLEFEKWLNSKQ